MNSTDSARLDGPLTWNPYLKLTFIIFREELKFTVPNLSIFWLWNPETLEKFNWKFPEVAKKSLKNVVRLKFGFLSRNPAKLP